MRKIVLLSALVLLVGVSAFAEGPPNYAALKLGMFFPQNVDVNGAGDLDMDSAFYGELALGHFVDKNWGIELGVGYTKPNKSVSVTSTAGSASADIDLTIIPVTLGVVGRLPMQGFEPYAMAGIGAYFTELEVSGSASIPGIGSASGSASESETAFGWYLGLGCNFNITKEFYLGVEGKYSWLYPSFSGLDVDVDGISVTANIGYRF